MSATVETSETAELLNEVRSLRDELRRSMMREPLTEAELAARWRVSKRQAKRICAKLGLQEMDMGHQTKRFRPADILRAEERCAETKRRKGR